MIKNLIKVLVALLVFTFLLIGLFSWQIQQSLNSELNINEQRLVTVEVGSSIHKFSKYLVNENIIDNRFWLRAYARIFPEQAAIKAGTYAIEQGETLKQLLTKVVGGKEFQLSVTFIEGTTVKEWLAKIKNHQGIEHTAHTATIHTLAKALNIQNERVEGWLFPDTYAFTLGSKDIDIFKRAHHKMQQLLEQQWQQRALDLPYKNSYEALIMASIIEKETAVLAEQPLIASVFVNRLRKKMRLQTDPTVIYGLGERFDGNITRAHLREKTAYNTYRINGLPPTPIAMPSATAIKAALNPATSEYLYFVSKGDGSHYFSTTLQEHNKAVRKYQLGKS